MKKLPFIIGVPLIAAVIVVGGAMMWKLRNQITTAPTTQSGVLPNAVENAVGSKPSNPFSSLFGPPKPTLIPTPTPASVAAMDAELNAMTDDGGTADFNSLKTDAAGL